MCRQAFTDQSNETFRREVSAGRLWNIGNASPLLQISISADGVARSQFALRAAFAPIAAAAAPAPSFVARRVGHIHEWLSLTPGGLE
jgi:hypothetical protein